MRLLLGLIIVACSVLSAADAPAGYRKVVDIPFAEVDGHRLALDLYLQEGQEHAPLVVFVHGGGWRNGSRNSMPNRVA